MVYTNRARIICDSQADKQLAICGKQSEYVTNKSKEAESHDKRLAQAIAAYMQADAKYLGAPSFAYQVDRYHIDRNGIVSFDAQTGREEVDGLVEALVEQGFVAQISSLDCEDEEVPAEEPGGEPAPNSAAQEGDTLTIRIPAASFTAETLNNLHNLIADPQSPGR